MNRFSGLLLDEEEEQQDDPLSLPRPDLPPPPAPRNQLPRTRPDSFGGALEESAASTAGQTIDAWKAIYALAAGNVVELPKQRAPDKWEKVPWSERFQSPEYWGSLAGEGVAGSATFLAGAGVGAVLGTLAAPGPGTMAGAVGGMAGGGLVSGLETIGSTY